MSLHTRLSILPALFGLALLAGPALAEQPATMPEDATTLLDEAAEVESLAAEAIELERVAKEQAQDAQNEELIQEGIYGTDQ